MELPNEIWELIVKNSKKTITEHINDMAFYELYNTMKEMKTRMTDMIKSRKSTLNAGDIVMDTKSSKLYCLDHITNDNYYTVVGIEVFRTDNRFTKYGYYDEVNSGIYNRLEIFKIEMVETRKEIDNLIYKYIETLERGDEITYRATQPRYTLYLTDTVIRVNKDHIRILNNVKIKKEKVLIPYSYRRIKKLLK